MWASKTISVGSVLNENRTDINKPVVVLAVVALLLLCVLS